MITREHKKEKTVGVKKGIFVGLLLLAGCSTTFTMQKVTGTYYQKYISPEASTSYEFSDSTFAYSSSRNLDKTDYARGSYKISSDTLILDYEPFNLKPESSSYTIESRKSLTIDDYSSKDSLGTVTIRTVNRKNKPLQSANMIVRDQSQQMIAGFGSDSLGYYPTYTITKKSKKISVFFVGRHRVIIPVDTLVGYHSEVDVLLTGTTYSQYDGTKKFLIKEANKNRLELEPLDANDNRERMVLVREGTEN